VVLGYPWSAQQKPPTWKRKTETKNQKPKTKNQKPKTKNLKPKEDATQILNRLQSDCGYFGVYQIGDVNARSCVVIGTFGSILTLKYAASYAVQRGVGISSTRA
jgi:hypothetical protein